jgi:predicted short-subunit dehydrogenase-like oxidoreductase (DUF2520 family)
MSGPASAPLRGLTAAVLGPGAVGCALAAGLHLRGADVALWGRRRGAAAAARRRIAGGRARPRLRASDDLERTLRGAGLVLLCAGDDGLADAAARAAPVLAVGLPRGGKGARPVALHTNGFHGADVLAPLAARGASCGVLHPLVPVPAGAGAEVLRGAWFAVAGDARATRMARKVARALGGRVLALARGTDAQAAYHAAASLASGGLIALFDAALGPLAGAADDPADARDALLVLMARTLANLEARGAGEALTGAAARGSAGLVARHVAALAEDASAAELYVTLARRMTALALAAGRIDARTARSVLARLAPR